MKLAWKTTEGASGPFAIIVAIGGGALLVLSRIPMQTLRGPNAPFIMVRPGILLAVFLGGIVICAVFGLIVSRLLANAYGGATLHFNLPRPATVGA